ncbi:MAG: AbrB/MazE/SpoVT family DNA-binding domain-containing protein [Deltaproteobacteria bacterium]|nr:AbrB/MazE/SpoVT family DNA-binding domain-containing protein [Deltaproteobacteria bacterium]MBW2044471.1 AbrB/MazE/SpoVT family DNA-binding domain-containing protein [Deltaproteobacteria bacterium]
MVVIENEARKWGHSLGVIIPVEIAKKINLKEGQVLEMKIKVKKRIDAFGKFKGANRFREEKSGHKEFW